MSLNLSYIVKPVGLLMAAAFLGTAPVAAQSQSLPFSKVVEANGVIYLAGHLGYDSVSRTYPDGGIEPQTRKTLENIRETLRSVNAGLADVVRCQVFLTDPKDFAGMNKVYRTFFPTHPPARTTVATALVSSKAKIEIECTAVRGHAQTQSK